MLVTHVARIEGAGQYEGKTGRTQQQASGSVIGANHKHMAVHSACRSSASARTCQHSPFRMHSPLVLGLRIMHPLLQIQLGCDGSASSLLWGHILPSLSTKSFLYKAVVAESNSTHHHHHTAISSIPPTSIARLQLFASSLSFCS